MIDEDAVSGWLARASLPPSHKPDSPQRGASKLSAGCLVRVPLASASVKEVFIRVGHERRALKIIVKDGKQYSDTDELDLIREVNVLQATLHCRGYGSC